MSGPAAPQVAPDPVVGFGQLLRIALFPSAIADVLVGLSLAHVGGVPLNPAVWLLVPASLGVYHGAMALNDWADRSADALERPERPIPSGAIPAAVALGIALLLMLGASCGRPLPGRAPVPGWRRWRSWRRSTTWRGAGPFGGRSCSDSAAQATSEQGSSLPWLVGGDSRLSVVLVGALMCVYGLHVASLSSLGRLEDGEDDEPLGSRPTRFLAAAGLTSSLLGLVCSILWLVAPAHGIPGTRDPLTTIGAIALALWNGRVLLGAAREMSAKGWSRSLVGAATGLCLRRLPLATASVAVIVAHEGWVGFGAFLFCLAGGYVSKALRKRFPLT